MKRVTTKVGDTDLVSIMRKRRGQMSVKSTAREPETKKKKTNSGGQMYENFLRKYNKLEDYIDAFNSRDLCYYFKKVAEEAGYVYVISNIQKDMHIFKELLKSYDSRHICAMIEFLYNSEQDYLDKTRLSPNILASRWVNTVSADTDLWVDDKYVPRSKQKYSKSHDRGEWKDTKGSTHIGGVL